MKPDWRRAKEVFAEVLDLPENERIAATKSRCGADIALETAVAKLIAAHRRATGLLQPPDDSADATLPLRRETSVAYDPTKIGAFHILGRLGAGGFGVVYHGRQIEPVDREVAIKLVHGGFEDADARARFLVEQRALARMQHPNIARLLDVGATDEGAPFVVMELVSGESIVRYCEGQRLSLTDRLRLFVDVCRAVHHAHQQAVIHCDLKPTNILVTRVDGYPTPKIIDFGIARRATAGPSAPTRSSAPIGTPRYMSPEQFRADAASDIRIDVFALGVVLSEMLTGRTPYESAVALDPTTPQAPTPPSMLVARRSGGGDLARRLRGDLDAIVSKAVAWSPEERYESAAALADDVLRHLRDEPVSAAPATSGYRFIKLIRRHRRAAFATAVSALALIVGAAASTIGMFMAVQSRDAARKAEADARREEHRSGQMLDFLLDDMISAAEPAVAMGDDVSIVDLLDEARAFADTRFADDPQTRMRILTRIGRAFSALSRSEPAVDALRSALKLADADETITPDSHVSLMLELAQALFQSGQHQEATLMRTDALAEASSKLGPSHSLTLEARRLALLTPNYEGDAIGELRSIVAELERQGLSETEQYILTLDELADRLSQQGAPDTLALRRRVSELASRLYPPRHPVQLLSRLREAKALSAALQHDQACEIAEKLLADATEVYRGSVAELSTFRFPIIEIFWNAGRQDDALRLAEETCAATADEFGVDSIPYTTAAQYLGRALLSAGNPGEAVVVLEDCWKARVRQWGAESPQALGIGIEYARGLIAVGEADRAAEMLETIREAERLSISSRAVADLLLGIAWDALGRHDEAAALVADVAMRAREAQQNGAPWSRIVLARIAEYHRACGSEEQAEIFERMSRGEN